MNFIIALLLAPLTILTACFAVEVLVGIRPLKSAASNSTLARVAVVVAAHDEEAGLGSTLEKLKRATGRNARILVVADNCTDSTAEIAIDQKVEVIKRNDRGRKGKGFALDHARSHLATNPPDVVVIIDADCTMDVHSLSNLVATCAASGRPCQATNLQQPPPGASPPIQLSTFAFYIKNVIRQRALQRIAGRANLLGTGMAFPWAIFAEAALATNSIVEDLKLGQELAEAGFAPLLVENATVWSDAETERNTISQRSRWEGGFMRNALRAGPKMLLRGLTTADHRELWAAIHAMIPPFALLILVDCAAILLALAVGSASRANPVGQFILIGSVTAALLGLAIAWGRGGWRFVSFTALCTAPLYVLWKIPMYARFAIRGAPQHWRRTDRR